ncbi:CCA tRNA nucleotidyltransferase [Thalassovita taeanensis]|uniref:Poly(A) polymerase n=1 Tax=Thalassovita taeanensis TaxID=657014 RepID=A0A1H9JLW5_9RHOB|nr:CCA tRNA nucleotidyltransferase [Thalassovita taeanensis]SEQ87575.1 poly(A) polymerase [Thalassovita taeanensis]
MRITADWITCKETQKVCSVLTDAGFQAYFVGGCVRNALIGAPVSDIDIATDAKPETVMTVAEKAGLRAVPTGIDHGTITVVSGHIPHEITTFRRDVETDGRRAVVAYSDRIEDDARRRDFTMNALYADPSGMVLDPLGGLSDLHARYVRFIEDPVQRIREDYLRILRFFRFHAWYGDPAGGLDAEGLAAIAGNLDGLSGLSKERIGAEMCKLLAAPDPAPAVAAMRAAGVLGMLLPGCDDRALSVLVHLESENGIAPDTVRRLACLGGQDVAQRLRLSNAREKALGVLSAGIGSGQAAAELGYKHGFDLARSIVVLRAAMFEMLISPADIEAAQRGSTAVFPVRAADLMPALQGPELGVRLKQLEGAWINSGFALTRKQLLSGD